MPFIVSMTMRPLEELRRFMEESGAKEDPYWRAVLSSDARNIFPKHELSKIDIAKHRVARTRLIMQHLPHFLILQTYAQQRQNIAKNTPQRELKRQIEQLMDELEECRNQQGSSDYEFQVLEHKGKVDLFCQQLTKKKGNQELLQMMEKSEKWRGYIEKHCRPVKHYNQLLNQRDKLVLAGQAELAEMGQCLLSGVAGHVIQQRLTTEVMKHRLRVMLEKGSFTPPEDDPWAEEWKLIAAQLQQSEGGDEWV